MQRDDRHHRFDDLSATRPEAIARQRFTVVYEGPAGCERDLAGQMKEMLRGRKCRAIKARRGDWLPENGPGGQGQGDESPHGAGSALPARAADASA